MQYVRGDVVVYAGSVMTEQGQRYYVQSVRPDGRLNLAAQEYPTAGRLYGVRQASVRPLGERVALCVCGHPLAEYREGTARGCACCPCLVHAAADQPPAGRVCLTVDAMRLGGAQAVFRWVCVTCGLSDGDYETDPAARQAGARDHTECAA